MSTAVAASRWHGLALGGGGGLARALVHLFIWRAIFRLGLHIWRVPVFGPIIDIVVGLALVTLLVLRSTLGPRWWRRRGGGSASRRDRDSAGSQGGSGAPGPRDW